jgi:hypothetical protein
MVGDSFVTFSSSNTALQGTYSIKGGVLHFIKRLGLRLASVSRMIFSFTVEIFIYSKGALRIMKKLKWVGIVFVVLLFIGAIANKNKPTGGNPASQDPNPATLKGYSLQSREASLLESLLKDDVANFSNGDNSTLGEGLLSVTAIDVAKAYNDNQVAADQKYFKKPLLLLGTIESINSGLGNEPYIALRGLNEFLSPQVHFHKANIEKISSLKKGVKIVLVCDGAGSIVGTPLFKSCQFSDDYANQKVTKLRGEINNFLEGKKPQSENVAMLPIAAITFARLLPENSACFQDGNKCIKELNAVMKDKGFENKLSAVTLELKSAGLHVPQKSKP